MGDIIKVTVCFLSLAALIAIPQQEIKRLKAERRELAIKAAKFGWNCRTYHKNYKYIEDNIDSVLKED